MQTAIVTAFFLLAICVILYLLYRRGRLARLSALPGEIVICEEQGVHVDENRIRGYQYGGCLVRLTDRRIVIAQKVPLFGNAYYVRFVIEYNAPDPGIDIGGMALRGYVPARVAASQVKVAPDGAGVSVSVALVHANGNRYSDLGFRSARAGEYSRAFAAQ